MSEQHTDKELIEAQELMISTLRHHYAGACHQRDNLLAALKALSVSTSAYRVELAAYVGHGASQPCDAERAAYIAIAKVENGK